MTVTKVISDRFKVPSLWATRLREHQVSVPDVLRRAGLPVSFFQQEKIYVTTAELFAFWRAIGETSHDPAIGLKLGTEPRFERYQPTAIPPCRCQRLRTKRWEIASPTCSATAWVRTSDNIKLSAATAPAIPIDAWSGTGTGVRSSWNSKPRANSSPKTIIGSS